MNKKKNSYIFIIIVWVYFYNVSGVLAANHCLDITSTGSAETDCVEVGDIDFFTGIGVTPLIGIGVTPVTGVGSGSKINHKLGELKNNYLSLSFKQGEKSKTLYKNEKQRAIARLSSTGSGNIQIRWEIARPPFSNQPDPLFTLIRQEQKILVGHQQKEFSSPILPSQHTGLYLLRIHLINSTTGEAQSALIRYYVFPAKQNINIQLLSPATATTLDKSMYFNWRINVAMSQANIQIFSQQFPQNDCNIADSQQHIIEIATQNTQQTKVSPIAANKLQQGQHYCWRVQAYNKGRVVGQSKARSFIWQTSTPKSSTSNVNTIDSLLFSSHHGQVTGQVIAIVKNQRERQQLSNHPDIQIIEEVQLQAYPLELMLIQSRSKRSEAALIAELQQQLPHIQVQANIIYQQNAGGVPQYSLSIMKVKRANSRAGSGVRIGMIDTLVDTQHASLRSANIKQINLLSSQNNNGKIHGTAIASLIVGQSGIRGIVPAAKLTSIAAFHAKPNAKTAGRSSSFILAKAFDKAVLQGLKVLNLSFGSARKDPLLNRLVKGARRKGIILVASVGNTGRSVYYPAALSSVIAVTATDANNRLYSRANRGTQVELAAPGVGIMAARANGKYTRMSGTSFASAHITGMIAYLISQGKSSSRSSLRKAAKDLGAAGKDNRFGYGLLILY